MGHIHVESERVIPAGIQSVAEFLRDYEARPRILTDNYRDYTVQAGGQGAGTVVSYLLAAGRSERPYRLTVEEPAPGRTLRERDSDSSLVNTWRLTPAGDGDRTRVALVSEWQGAGGIGGFFERTFAPRALRRIYAQVLERLEAEVAAGRSPTA